MISDKKIEIGECHIYDCDRGNFLKIEKTNREFIITDAIACREEFANIFDRGSKWVGFQNDGINIKRINKFFEIAERKLRLKTKTVFYYTDHEDIVLINLPNFWRLNIISREVFTLFLRCAATYYSNSFEESLRKYHLISKCRGAINWFLKGHTKAKFRFTENDWDDAVGFSDKFAYARQQDLKKMLVKP